MEDTGQDARKKTQCGVEAQGRAIPILVRQLNAGRREQTTRLQQAGSSTHNHAYLEYIFRLNAIYDLFMTGTITEPPQHWPNRAHYRQSHEVYTCSMNRQLLPRARASSRSGLGLDEQTRATIHC